MKRYIALILSAFLLFSVVSVAAYENGESDSEMSEDVVAILREQMDASELEILKNKDYYWDGVPDDFSEYPILEVYPGLIWDTADLSPQELKDYVDDQFSTKSYFVFYKGDQILRIGVGERDGQVIVAKSRDSINTKGWAEDLRNISRYMNLRGIDCEVLEIAMIYSGTSWQGSLIYLITDKGNFMVYYPLEPYTTSVIWTEEEFRTYAKAYEAYLQENAYGPNGEPTGGVGHIIPFLKEEYSDVQLIPFDVMQARRNVEESPAPNEFPPLQEADTENGDRSNWVIAAAIGTVAVVTAGAVAVVIFRKKRKAQ